MNDKQILLNHTSLMHVYPTVYIFLALGVKLPNGRTSYWYTSRNVAEKCSKLWILH